jgi:hypothetical protein
MNGAMGLPGVFVFELLAVGVCLCLCACYSCLGARERT